jgi:hypothetical protein
MRLHGKNHKQLWLGGNIWESNVQFWGDWLFNFFSNGEKGLSDVGQNGWEKSWSQSKICAINI